MERTPRNRFIVLILMLGVLIEITFYAIFFIEKLSSRTQNSLKEIENNVGEVVKIINCGKIDIFSSLFPDYFLYAQCFGSGISIKEGYILSSAHIFYKEELLPFINEQYYAEIIKKDLDSDLILLKIPATMKTFKIASSIEVGEKVIIMGYPSGLQSLLFGRVSNFNEEIILLDAKVIKGTSGGAVVNEKGELLGVFTGGRGEPDMLAIAVNFLRIKKFLKGTPAEYK